MIGSALKKKSPPATARIAPQVSSEQFGKRKTQTILPVHLIGASLNGGFSKPAN